MYSSGINITESAPTTQHLERPSSKIGIKEPSELNLARRGLRNAIHAATDTLTHRRQVRSLAHRSTISLFSGVFLKEHFMSKSAQWRDLHQTMIAFAKRDVNYWHSEALAACTAGDETRMAHSLKREDQAVWILIRMVSV